MITTFRSSIEWLRNYIYFILFNNGFDLIINKNKFTFQNYKWNEHSNEKHDGITLEHLLYVASTIVRKKKKK
jgi:hypothetical protein